MREPCRIIVRMNTPYDYGQRRRRLIRRAVRQVEPHPHYQAVETGEIRAGGLFIRVYRRMGHTQWTSILEEVSRFSYLVEEVSIEPEGSN